MNSGMNALPIGRFPTRRVRMASGLTAATNISVLASRVMAHSFGSSFLSFHLALPLWLDTIITARADLLEGMWYHAIAEGIGTYFNSR